MPAEFSLTHHRITVLLIDDQAMIGEAIRRMLSTEPDIDFHYCQDPTQAIKAASQIAPTVILQDLVMPEVEGLTLVRYFRAHPKTREVPLIVLSSKEDPVVKADAFALGANDYMVKFPDKLEVLARIRYHSKGYINLLERNEAFEQLQIANRFIRKTFGRYLSDDIVNTILESPEGLTLGGEKRLVTIMMTDLRGFTSIGERLPAESVVSMINMYLEVMTEIIMRYQGTIDEFIGDAILVIFGAPITRDDDAKRAVACALDMQLAMQEVNQRNRDAGFPEVSMGIGLNTGDVVVGNIGSKKRTKYGVVGSTVNLTNRIESYTVGGQILISESTLTACGPILRIDSEKAVMPKGVKEPMTIYDIGGIGWNYDIFLPEKEPVELQPLSHPVSITFIILAGKHAGQTVYEGKMVKMDDNMAEVLSSRSCRELTNIKMTLFDDAGREIANDVYGKITDTVTGDVSGFTVTFTSVPPEAEAFLEQVRP